MQASLSINCSRSENGTSEVCLDVSFITAVILVSLTSSLFILACITLCLYYKWRLCRHIVETRIGIVVFFLGALLAVITTLSSYTEKSVYIVYLFFLLIFIGIVVLLVGSAVLFENASPDPRPGDVNSCERLPVGHKHGSIGLIIWAVTVPLCILELLFAVCAAKHGPFEAYAPFMYIALVQKVIQAKLYHFSLRHKVAKRDMRMGCSWLLKIISVFNFAFWIDWIATARSDNDFVDHLFGNGFSIVKAAYNALLIDYRLLCGLLFLEHSLELMEVHTDRNGHEFVDPEANEALMQDCYNAVVNVEISHSAAYGYAIGSLLMSTQLIAGLQYFGYVGSWSNIFPIIACVFVVVFGFLLLSVNGCARDGDGDRKFNRKNWRETESKAIDIMVCFMGTIGFVFWFMKASYCGVWAFKFAASGNTELSEYLTWTTLKIYSYAITVVFQLYFFVKMGPHFGYDQERSRLSAKQFYVCTITMALLSLVVSFVVDEYNGPVEKLLGRANISNAMSAFLQAAGPIHLGFSLHMFLHFFIMNRRLAQFQYKWRHRQTQNSQNSRHCSESSTERNYYHIDAEPREETNEEREPLISRSRNQLAPSGSTMTA